MTSRRITIRGETYVTLAVAADCYQVEVRWLHTVFDRGLLGPGEVVGSEVAIPVGMLDRVARLRGLQLAQGLDLASAAALIEWLDAD